MKINLIAAGAFAVALAMPIGLRAQQGQPPGPPASQSFHHHGTPSAAKLQHRWMKRFGHLNLSGDQQQRVQSIINQYSQQHPEGSQPDRDASRALHQQLMGVLTPDQQSAYHQQMRERREQMQEQRAQMHGQGPAGQGPATQGGPQQAPPNQPPPNEQPPNGQPPNH